MKPYRTAIVVILFLLFESCALFKGSKTKETDPTIVEKDTLISEMQMLLDSIDGKLYPISTMQALFTGDYEGNSTQLPLKGVIRISKGRFIWISIRPAMAIEASRILITTDSIRVMDRLNNQYYSESFSLIEEKFNFKANYEILESVFIGKMFLYPNSKSIKDYQKTKVSDSSSIFLITNGRINENPNFNHIVSFNKTTLLLQENKILFSGNHQKIQIFYDDYKSIDNKMHYSKMALSGENEKEHFNLKCTFDHFVFNTELTAPFKVPENYKRSKYR